MCQSSLSAARVAAALAQLPASRFVDSAGQPRVRVVASIRRLEGLANLSRPSVIAGLLELEALEVADLYRLGQRHHNAPAAYSMPAPPEDQAPAPPPSMHPEQAELIRELDDLGVAQPVRLMSQYGYDALRAALEELERVMQRTAVRSPGGLLVHILGQGMRRRRLVPTKPSRRDPADFEVYR